MDADLTTSLSSNFYPRPPRGGRPTYKHVKAAATIISIHALREEGDSIAALANQISQISIHALREEGDARDLRRFDGIDISIHALREEDDR